MEPLLLTHLGESGLRLQSGPWTLFVDPPDPVKGPALITWSETERLRGLRPENPVIAHPTLVDWLGRGERLVEGGEVAFAGMLFQGCAYQPIPWATPIEAARKTWSGLRHPLQAAQRLRRTLRRPADPPMVVQVQLGAWRVLLAGQSLHRFAPELPATLSARFSMANVVIAGTDFDDEAATGRGFAAFGGQRVLVDLIGEVRERLLLPPPRIAHTVGVAPPGTLLLSRRGTLTLTNQ